MEIILGKSAGFCYGVKNAVDKAKDAIKNNEEIYCLGEIVHNRTVIEDLEKNGLKFTEKIEDIKNKVIIRAHGESEETYNKLKEKGISILDYTCPKVTKTHEIAENYNKKGYFVILIGIKKHPEAIGTLSYAGKNSYLLQDKNQYEELIDKINKSKLDKILIMAQTTYNSKKFDEMVEDLKGTIKGKEIEVQKTICGATEIRQRETIQIAKNVDLMIIIGDKKSSNTNKLYDISKENCKKAIFVQNYNELNMEELKQTDIIGIMAGASTPKEDIDEVIKKIEKNNKRGEM